MAVIDTVRIGRHFYKFKYICQGNYFDIDIVEQPKYGKRAQNLTLTMRLPSERSGMKIGFGKPDEIKTLDDARKWAFTWARLTSNYIKTGKRFSNE